MPVSWGVIWCWKLSRVALEWQHNGVSEGLLTHYQVTPFSFYAASVSAILSQLSTYSIPNVKCWTRRVNATRRWAKPWLAKASYRQTSVSDLQVESSLGRAHGSGVAYIGLRGRSFVAAQRDPLLCGVHCHCAKSEYFTRLTPHHPDEYSHSTPRVQRPRCSRVFSAGWQCMLPSLMRGLRLGLK
ncbi:hypothetical protein BOTBODRAFT_58288 [Botryobasidium botryosum FD-172 SS1]|uniref:Uncharacterized protein n=1 Tax=Botryobasidium botryosum (strain FD-172 SS1) TaxID=930990 RepID=A0A067MDX4_BOTB1|nr:hypothetical protein BOTBODRAFT_58288 [Botryobasidium botryosum FD-172 SS1]